MLALEWGLDTEEELRSTPRSAPLNELLMLALLSMRSAGATLTPALLPVTCTQGTHHWWWVYACGGPCTCCCKGRSAR